MVGYTNAGKSTLLKLLSGADVLIEDRLFATLDTTVRQVNLVSGRKMLLSDTVGFIRKLPPHLIASFKSTLAEASEADILLHVVDISHPKFREHIAVVNDTLHELEVTDKPTILVFNKIDKVQDRSIINEVKEEYPSSVFISADRGIQISTLNDALLEILDHDVKEQTLRIEQSDYGTIAKLHEIAELLDKEYEGNSVKVRFRIDKKKYGTAEKTFG